MTSSDLNETPYTVEEGEIIDDDESSVSALPDKAEFQKSINDLTADHRSTFKSPKVEGNSSTAYANTYFDSASKNRRSNSRTHDRETLNSVFNNYSRSRTNSISRRRRSNWKKRVPIPRVTPNHAFKSRRQASNVRDSSRRDLLYEERLRDYQMKQKRLNQSSKKSETKIMRPIVAGLVETQTTGTSLLKRLVGSGSVGIKILDDNVLHAPNKCNNIECTVKPNYYLENDLYLTETADNFDIEPILVNCNSGTVEDGMVKKKDSDKIVNDNFTCSSADADDELKLRLEALKTAVLRKHSERLKEQRAKVSTEPATVKHKDFFYDESLEKQLETETARLDNDWDLKTSVVRSSFLEKIVDSRSTEVKTYDQVCGPRCSKDGVSTDLVTDKGILEDNIVSDAANIVKSDLVCNDLFCKENMKDSKVEKCSDVDDELKLRMEALKTAVLKKHTERLKRGYVLKKTTGQLSTSVTDSFIEDVELLNSYIDLDSDYVANPSEKVQSIAGSRGKSDCSDMSMDSNYVSDDDVPQQQTADCNLFKASDTGLKRPSYSYPKEFVKRQRLDENSQDTNDLNLGTVISDLNEEELELRALALKSFLQRKALKDSDTDSDKASVKLERVTNAFDGEIDMVNEQHLESNRKNDNSENWEELDEDILRAQLLKTLSANLPEHEMVNVCNDQEKTDSSCQKTPKPSGSLPSKIEQDVELEIQSKLWSEMMVPKLVISLGSDSESDSESPQALDFVSSLELFLQEAKEKSEKFLQSSTTELKTKGKTITSKESMRKLAVKKGTSSTPTAVKHLPIQQQEEYRRLKLKLAEKMKLNVAKDSNNKLAGNSKALPIALQGDSLNFPVQKQKNGLSSSKVSEPNVTKPNQIKVTTKFNTKLVNVNNATHKKSNVPLSKASRSTNKKIIGIHQGVSKPISIRDNKVINRVPAVVSAKKNTLNKSSSFSSVKSFTPTSKTDSSQLKKPFTVKTLGNPVTSLKQSGTQSTCTETSLLTASLKKTKKQSTLPVEDVRRNNEQIKKLKDNKLLNTVDITSQVYAVIKDESGLTVDKTVLSKKPNDPSENKITKRNLASGKIKGNEGNSDKENLVSKDKIYSKEGETGQRLLPLPSTDSLLSDLSLIDQLKMAETSLKESAALVSKLEKELEEAKKIMITRGKIVSELKEEISDAKSSASVSVKIQEKLDKTKDEDGGMSQKIGNNLNAESCWDPDGVVCPFQLAGSCKDPCCSFHHIQIS